MCPKNNEFPYKEELRSQERQGSGIQLGAVSFSPNADRLLATTHGALQSVATQGESESHQKWSNARGRQQVEREPAALERVAKI